MRVFLLLAEMAGIQFLSSGKKESDMRQKVMVGKVARFNGAGHQAEWVGPSLDRICKTMPSASDRVS